MVRGGMEMAKMSLMLDMSGALKATKFKITEVQFENLNKYPNMTITGVGEENFYFEWEGNKYFCKCL